MKLRLTVQTRTAMEDITLECDSTTTIGQVARALARSRAAPDARAAASAERCFAPLTLLGRASLDGRQAMLDPAAPVGTSGLQSGWIIEPAAEFGGARNVPRLVPMVGSVEVCSGDQAGVLFSLVPGGNTVGRDPSSRVHLLDASVSRRHAVIEAGEALTVVDRGSANGLVLDGERLEAVGVVGSCDVMLGKVLVRVHAGQPAREVESYAQRVPHTRAPRLEPRFTGSERQLPSPPSPAAPNRMPVLAVLPPMMMGGAMFALTASPMSLVMVAFSPLMMIGSWADGRFSAGRRRRRELAEFARALEADRRELDGLRDQEIAVRRRESPTAEEVAEAICDLGRLLWTRRPEHRSFLEVRFGTGVLPSRTTVALPSRADASSEHWQRLRDLVREFECVAPVPVLERLDRCGSIGVAGERPWAEGMARSLVLQLVGLHSPGELVVTCFASEEPTRSGSGEWAWLKWLPHVDSAASPVAAWHLSDDAVSATRLIVALEGALANRDGERRTRRVRSHLDEGPDAEHDGPVREPPRTPVIVVLVLDDRHVDRARLVELAEAGPDLGIHLIWVTSEAARLPAACRTFVELGAGGGAVTFVRTGSEVQLRGLEHVELPVAQALARRIAPVDDDGVRLLDETDLPRAVHLREIHPVDLLGGPAPVLQAWRSTGSLPDPRHSDGDREPAPLRAVVGQGEQGPVSIDLRAHGPHALVGGTTGAGKSEFLQTWIMSLAASASPSSVTFLLVDYKGGAAFAECVDLPHAVGLVTDLDGHLVRRALASLRAELRYREELLAAHGAKDLPTMQRRSDAAPPALVIVIDEFAALANEVPEFVDGVVDVAQRGRSLGLHLIMATQRPAGVIKDNLRANTNLRIALRVADEADSGDVIGVTDAAFFDAEIPGRGALKVGPGRIAHFQTGYLGGRVSDVRTSSMEIRTLRFTEGEPWRMPVEQSAPVRAGRRLRDIERLRDAIAEAAREAGLGEPRRPWLDALPPVLDLEAVRAGAEQGVGTGRGDADAGDAAVIGVLDDPGAQSQRPVAIDLERDGHLAVIGASGSGRTTTLLSLAASLSAGAERFPVRIYAIDASGGGLEALRALPTVGTVAPLSDAELTARVLALLREEIGERRRRFVSARASGLRAYRAGASERGGEPRLVLLLDGFAAFRTATETLGGDASPFRQLCEIMTAGRACGVHVVLTADRAGALPPALAASVQRQLVLRLASGHDYGVVGVPADLFEHAPPGRAVFAGDTRELQIAVAGGAPVLAAQTEALERLGEALRMAGVARAPELRNAPEILPFGETPVAVGGRPVIGIDSWSLEPVGMPTRGLCVIAGPSGAGLSNASLVCTAAYARWASREGATAESVLLTLADDGLLAEHDWTHTAVGEDEVARLAGCLVVALGGRPARGVGERTIGVVGAEAPGGPAARNGAPLFPEGFPSRDGLGIIVVERAADAEGTPALSQLTALAKAARRASVPVVFEFELGGGGRAWDLYSALKQPRWGLSLQPDDGESQTPFREALGRTKRRDFPPGRGFAVAAGNVAPVQVALAAASQAGEGA